MAVKETYNKYANYDNNEAFSAAHDSMTISNNGKTVTPNDKRCKRGHFFAYGSMKIRSTIKNKYVWKFIIKNERATMHIGITQTINKNASAWPKSYSYGMSRNPVKRDYVINNSKTESYGTKWKTGDTIWMIADFNRKEISFNVNGINQGVAFRNIVVGPTYYLFVEIDTYFKDESVTIAGFDCFEIDPPPPPPPPPSTTVQHGYHINKRPKDDISDDDMQFKAVLQQWKLSQYANILEQEGWDDIDLWPELDENALIDMGFKTGHRVKFLKRIKTKFGADNHNQKTDEKEQNQAQYFIKKSSIQNTILDNIDNNKQLNNKEHYISWKYKKMIKWTMNDVISWIQNMDLEKKWKGKLIDTIQNYQCIGRDIRCLKTSKDVGASFDIASNKSLCNVILANIKNFKPQTISKNNALEHKPFQIHIFSQDKLLILNEKVTKNVKIQYVKALYKIQSGV
eukprot:440639_1